MKAKRDVVWLDAYTDSIVHLEDDSRHLVHRGPTNVYFHSKCGIELPEGQPDDNVQKRLINNDMLYAARFHDAANEMNKDNSFIKEWSIYNNDCTHPSGKRHDETPDFDGSLSDNYCWEGDLGNLKAVEALIERMTDSPSNSISSRNSGVPPSLSQTSFFSGLFEGFFSGSNESLSASSSTKAVVHHKLGSSDSSETTDSIYLPARSGFWHENSAAQTDDQTATPHTCRGCFMKLLISDHLAGLLIGPGNQQLRSIKSRTGAKLVLSPNGKYYPGSADRLLTVSCMDLQPLLEVVNLVVDFVCQMWVQNPRDDARPTIQIAVPRLVIGSLIGRRGAFVQSVREKSGAYVNVSPLFVPPHEACSERVVTISSSERCSLLSAAFRIVEKVNSHPDNTSCRNVVYVRRPNRYEDASCLSLSPESMEHKTLRNKLHCASHSSSCALEEQRSPLLFTSILSHQLDKIISPVSRSRDSFRAQLLPLAPVTTGIY